MTVTSIDIDPAVLEAAKRLTGAQSNREVVDLALKMLTARQQQKQIAEEVLAEELSSEHVSQETIDYPVPEQAAAGGV